MKIHIIVLINRDMANDKNVYYILKIVLDFFTFI